MTLRAHDRPIKSTFRFRKSTLQFRLRWSAGKARIIKKWRRKEHMAFPGSLAE